MGTAAAGRSFSVALSTDVDQQLASHLERSDGQEDVVFALYRGSTGASRDTALLVDLVPPQEGDRLVYGNASFTSDYFLRAASVAAESDCGLALLHSHPGATTWQGLSRDDHAAEADHAVQTQVLTGQPLVGLTYGTGNGSYSARVWPVPNQQRVQPHPRWACTVRVVGADIRVSYNPDMAQSGSINKRTIRTVHAWGREAHERLTRMRVGVVGAGSVAQLVAEALARTGFTDIVLIDFDTVEEHNLDRLMHATTADIGRAKVRVLADALKHSAVADAFDVTPAELSLVEPDGWQTALDCDVLFGCVDRPWPRFALNVAAYAHLIPVIDGGISVDVRDVDSERPYLYGAEWRAHLVAPGRKCLECLGQYEAADVTLERAGLLDDEHYINSLPPGHHLRQRENVFAFSMACAAAELLELFRAVVQPSGIPDIGAILTHWATSTVDIDASECNPACPFQHLMLAAGDAAPVDVTGKHRFAEQTRTARRPAAQPRHRWWARIFQVRMRSDA